MRVILVATDASPPAPARKDPGAVVVNVKRREIWRLGKVAEFNEAKVQFRAAVALIVRRGALLTHREYIEALYGDDFEGGPLWAGNLGKWGNHVRRRLATIGLQQQTIYGHGARLAKAGQRGLIISGEPTGWGHQRRIHRSSRPYVRREGGAQ